MQLEIIRQEELSLDDLVNKQSDGYSVLRSAHVGNARLYNQVLANVGVQMLLVDHNVTGIDKNYMPESVITGQESLVLAEDMQVCSRTEVLDPFEGIRKYLDELHAENLSAAFPESRVVTNTEYLRSNESIAAELFNICAEAMPELFKREIETNDTVTHRIVGQPAYRASDALQLQDNPRTDGGVLIPNEIDILINFVVEFLNTEQPKQYHLSGPDMISYINGIIPTLQKLSAAVASKASFASMLPSTLQVEMVPGTAFRFASTIKNKLNIDTFAEALANRSNAAQATSEKRKEFFASPDANNPAKREQFLRTIRNSERQFNDEVFGSFSLCPEFLDTGTSIPTLTQYDAIADGGLYVPEFCSTMTVRELQILYKSMVKVLNLRDCSP
jgi:hypothetical protein